MASDFQFISTDTGEIVTSLIGMYEALTERTVNPADPERLFILWVADVFVLLNARINYAANQNIPSRAIGANLDALSELFFSEKRPQEKPSTCTIRFHISAPQTSAILVPSGTRVTTNSDKIYWATGDDVYIAAGAVYMDTKVNCQTFGKLGNGYAPGQIGKVVDLYPYVAGCENLTTSDGGSDAATDEEYYALLRESQDAFSVAGPIGAYSYWAKTVSTDIVDVKPISPIPGHANIYLLMRDGGMASDTIKELVLAACNDKSIRPLTDFVTVEDPEKVSYAIDFTYYILRDSPQSALEIEAAVNRAVDQFVLWQSEKLGRDINPTVLISLLRQAGVKRVELHEPAFRKLNDGSNDGSDSYNIPQIAVLNGVQIVSGGYEDD